MQERINRHIDITGRRVDFTSRIPLAWGVEISILLDQQEKPLIKKRSGIKIPESISSITYLDLNPQESLPIALRTIKSDWTKYKDTSLQDLAKTGRGASYFRNERLSDLFYLMFGKNNEEIDEFNHLLSNTSAYEIVIVYGHGGSQPFVIGEQDVFYPKKGGTKQKPGNTVPVAKILKRYNDPVSCSAILLATCCYEKNIKVFDVPVVSVYGKFEDKMSWNGLLETRISYPKNYK